MGGWRGRLVGRKEEGQSVSLQNFRSRASLESRVMECGCVSSVMVYFLYFVNCDAYIGLNGHTYGQTVRDRRLFP